MFRHIDVTEVAESGLNECAGAGEPGCMPGFGVFLTVGTIASVAVIVWLSLAAAVTPPIRTTTTLSRLPRALWLITVWCIPILGAAAWLVRSRTPPEQAP